MTPLAERLQVRAKLHQGSSLKAEWVHDAQASNEPQLLADLLHPRFKVLYVGGYGHPGRDPMPVIIAHQLAGKGLTLLDAQDYKLNEKSLEVPLLDKLTQKAMEYRERGNQRKPIPAPLMQKIDVLSQTLPNLRGSGGLRSYRRGLQEIRDRGLIAKTIKLHPGLAWATGLKKGTFHLIVDRGTMHFITQSADMDHDGSRMEKTVNHYLDILPDGGKTCFFVSERMQSVSRVISDQLLDAYLGKLMEAGKIHVREVKLEEANHDSHPDVLYHWSDYAYNRALVVTKLTQKQTSTRS